jgi:hypothetical protein
MPASALRVSAALQGLLDKGVLDRLPVSFSAFCIDQMREWDLLFPAEHSYYERLVGLFDRSAPQSVERLFAPIREIEQKMGVNDKTWPAGRFTLEQVDFLNRNPHYPEWRRAVAAVFAEIDPVLDAEIARGGHARLVIVIAPADLPVDVGRMWTRLEKRGKRIGLETPEHVEEFVPMLLTGEKSGKAPTIAERFASDKKGGAYSSWIVEVGGAVSQLGTDSKSVVKYSYAALDTYRKRLMQEVQHVVEGQDVPGPRQLSARLKQLKILASEGHLARDPILAEFARAILLSGNGTLLINNTFVEWATIQAVRRARPSVAIVSFGIRNKVKPFSSLLIYADQEAVSPIPSQMDSLGSYVDLEVFYQYILQEFEKYAEYKNNTAYLFVGEGMEEGLVIGPPDFPLVAAKGPFALPAVFKHVTEWLGV